MKQVHLVMPFMRNENKQLLLDAYRPMNVILHPIMFADEVSNFDEAWVIPCIIPLKHKQGPPGMEVQNVKRNYFIEHEPIIDDDYYVAVDDDDMYEDGVLDEIKKMDDDILIISMKRGKNIPANVIPDREYPTSTLVAHPDNVAVGEISNQQSFVKGKVFRKYLYDDQGHCGDGRLAVRRKEAGEQMVFRPDLFALMNFYEPGRWEGLKISFGVIVNDWTRFKQVFQQSQIVGEAHFIKQPESATKGLNKLLEIMEADNADIAVLSHQDMHYKADWIGMVRSQIEKLPESWVVAGIIGKDAQGRISGIFRDMRIPNYFDTSDIHEFPQPASCFDECCIIVNLKKGFRFDEELEGFDLYGSLCVLQALKMGGTAWIINAYAEHYCSRSMHWSPDQKFCDNFKWLYNRFPGMKVDTTAIGFKEDGEANRAA